MLTFRSMHSLPIFTLLIITTLSSFAFSQEPLVRGLDRYDDIVLKPVKRPFCNAFTGCGKRSSTTNKRSTRFPRPVMEDDTAYKKFGLEDSLDSLMSMSSEPAVEELSRQILSEAKLWEALQEAGAEIARNRKQQQYTGV